jgi:hypothetical protein
MAWEAILAFSEVLNDCTKVLEYQANCILHIYGTWKQENSEACMPGTVRLSASALRLFVLSESGSGQYMKNAAALATTLFQLLQISFSNYCE